MFRVFRSELLKQRRTFSRKLVIFAPMAFLLMVIPARMLSVPAGTPVWQIILTQVFNWWPVLFVPLGTALLAGLAQQQENKAGRYRGLRAHSLPPSIILVGKVGGIAIHLLLASLILMAVTLARGLLTASGPAPWKLIVISSLMIWTAGLAIIPIQMFFAAWKGMAVSMGVGLAGMILGVIFAPTGNWIWVPWAWPLRLMCAVVGVHPNGVGLEPGDPLLDPSVIPVGLLLSGIAFLALTVLTAWWFGNREVRE
jgi:ABC-2 type transport system permease protein